jgi:hypothetical protein
MVVEINGCLACGGTEGEFHGLVHKDLALCLRNLKERTEKAEARAEESSQRAAAAEETAKLVGTEAKKLRIENLKLTLQNERLRLVAGLAYDVLAEKPSVQNTEMQGLLQRALADLDRRHHAPMCPANHFHGGKKPRAACDCGAEPHPICPSCRQSCDKDSWTCDVMEMKAFCPHCHAPCDLGFIIDV